MSFTQLGIRLLEVRNQLCFCLFFAEHGRHVVVQMRDNEAVNLGE